MVLDTMLAAISCAVCVLTFKHRDAWRLIALYWVIVYLRNMMLVLRNRED